MKNNESISDKIIFECMISLKNDKFDTLLTLTEKQLLFKRKKGIFQKKYKIVKNILIDDIKIVNDKVKIKQKKNRIIIYTNEEEIYFICQNMFEAKQIEEEINKIILGENFVERTSKKGISVLNTVEKTAKIVGGVAVAVTGAYAAVKDNGKNLKEVAKTIVDIIKK